MKLNLIKNLSSLKLQPKAIEDAVWSFVKDSDTKETGADLVGLYNQTIENIFNYTNCPDNSRQFWMAEQDGDVMAYTMCHVSRDVDNRLCYWITQAWVHPELRGSKTTKEFYKILTDEAKKLLCSHIVVPSSRGVDAYCRFLGEGWHLYTSLLKKDI
jgi:hypothetical protein